MVLLYQLVEYSWLNKIAFGLVLSLPFERIPSLSLPLGTVKIGYLLVIFETLCIICLLLKKNEQLLKIKFHYSASLMFWFFAFSIPSWFFVVDITRFLSTSIATLMSFLSAFYIVHFLKNPKTAIKCLIIVFLGVALFGVYQFVGDFIGLPHVITGIRLIHTKKLNGSPRIPATFNEPAYFANALILMVTVVFFYYLINKSIFLGANKIPFLKRFKEFRFPYQKFNLVALFLFSCLFFLTIAKSAFTALPLIVFLVLIFTTRLLKKGIIKFEYLNKLVVMVFISLIYLSVLLIFSSTLQETIVQTAYSQIQSTVRGESGTSIERRAFFKSAAAILPNNIITGIGSGQFGTAAENYIQSEIPYLKDVSTREIIVFNVFLETWLEYGLLSLLIFLALFIKAIVSSFKLSPSIYDKEYLILKISLGIYLTSSLLQWNFISPIYITPIFIALGLIYNLERNLDFKATNKTAAYEG